MKQVSNIDTPACCLYAADLLTAMSRLCQVQGGTHLAKWTPLYRREMPFSCEE